MPLWPAVRRRAAASLAIPADRDARIFAVAAVVDALGNGLYLPITALFFVKVAGLPTQKVGVGLSITGAVGLLGPVLAGPPVDRYGARRTVLVLYGVRAACYAAYPLVRGFWPFVALVGLTGVADTMVRPALQALVATLTDESDRVTTLAFVRAVRNIGYGVGGLLVAAALAIGGRGPYVALVLGDAVTFVVAGALLMKVREARRTPRAADEPRAGYLTVLRDRRFMALTLAHGVTTLHLSVLIIGFPLWIDQRTSAPTWVAGAIVTMNSALVVVLQVPFSRRAVTVRQGGGALWRSGVWLAATCALLALTPGLPRWPCVALLLVIGVVECVAELWESVGGWAVSLGLAPEAARGRYLGVWALGFGVHDVAGPALMAFVVTTTGRAGWLLVGALALVAGAVCRRLASAPDRVPPPPQGLDPLDDGVHDGRVAEAVRGRLADDEHGT